MVKGKAIAASIELNETNFQMSNEIKNTLTEIRAE